MVNRIDSQGFVNLSIQNTPQKTQDSTEASLAATKVLIANPAPVEDLTGHSRARALRKIDYNNTVHLSGSDPGASLGYSLLRDTIQRSNDEKLILSERGFRRFYRAYGQEITSHLDAAISKFSRKA